MKTKYYIISFLASIIQCGLQSCEESFNGSSTIDINLIVEFPSEIEKSKINDATVTFRNISTGTSSEFLFSETISLLPGLYDVEYNAHFINNSGNKVTVKGVTRSASLSSGGEIVRISVFTNLDSDDLIISEVFFTGTLQNSGNQYLGDDYIKLYNNTDHIIYADGLNYLNLNF